jgi:SAM-dependent methyltransferase
VSEDSPVTAAEIARIVGVGRAAVSNWRRRYLDFPQPVGGTPASPTFSWSQVETWLKANGRLSRPSERPVEVEDETVSPAPLDDARLAKTLAGLLPPLDTGLVLDPACGAGRLLTSAASTAKTSVSFAGQDIESAAVETARDGFENISRNPLLLAQGDPFTQDALGEFRMRADVVLCAPPIGAQGAARPIPLAELTLDPRWEFGLPAASDPVGVWVQICFSYLKPGGTAILLLPAALAVKPAGRRIRAELVRRGVIQTVIGLPHRYSLRVSGGLHIWILRRPSTPPAYEVRMVDLSEADDLPESRREWERIFDDRARTRVVSALDLLDEEVALVPTRYVRLPMSDLARLYEEVNEQLGTLLTKVIAETPAFDPAERRIELPLTSVTELQRAGALEMLARDAGVRFGDIALPANAEPIVVSGPEELEEVNRRGGIVEIIRCDPNQLDPSFVAGFLGAAARHRDTATTSGTSIRSATRKARIPRISLPEQQRYGVAFRRISDWARLSRQAWLLGREAADWALHGLTTGVLDPGTGPDFGE